MNNRALPRNLSLFLAAAAMIAAACDVCLFGCEDEITVPTPTPTVAPTPTVEVPIPVTGACTVEWTNPAAGARLPNYGPFKLEWSPVIGAAGYKVRFYPEGTTPDPSQDKQTTDTSMRIYLESHPQGGKWNFEVEAVDAAGQPLCASAVSAEKDAYEAPSQGSDGEGGDAGSSAGPSCDPYDSACSP